MSKESDDLMLNLFCVADEVVVPAPSPGKSFLASLKPYPSHKGDCGGIIAMQIGVDEDDEVIMHVTCCKCGREDFVQPKGKLGNDTVTQVMFDKPDWVDDPHV